MTEIKRVHSWLAVVAAAFLLASCSSKDKNNEAQDTLEMPVLTIKTQDTTLQTAYVADIQALRNVEVRSRLKGFLEKIFVDEGKPVTKGQILFKINDEEYRLALSRAKAMLGNAEADAVATRLEVDRVKMLVNKNVLAASELQVAQSKLKADEATIAEARANVQSAQTHIAYTTIRAPFDGIIDRIPLKGGSLIDEGTLLTSISDISSIYAYFSFPENEYLKYQRILNSGEQEEGANTVKLGLADGSSYAHSGTIETIEGEIEQTTGSISLRAKFPNPHKLLRHGASGKIYITSEMDNAIMIPQKSVFEVQDKSYVYLVGPDNKLKMHSFVPLTRFSQYYIVKEGLKAGDKILFEGAQNARDGMVIKPSLLRTAPVLAAK
ncbi:efflux RND transporter periplasmic adaptor subunit [Mucilaginibacter daejeonensis]|uniref:efflux RND transporter periplasmic adaptor subunit n=1 Tax=Mucilaginibacter daejeonensis TaxID=398049 RepID=UPI001D177058|nr:efflux RND transporter periplasmic adaptor subunit [Mucilaginibacter daejeonensis]UEG53702.1 efflux RND transporter periplasmic adaptor subunit [Mucilaginibacter daejeonensis]